MNKKIAFIGCGNMGEALLKGVLNKKLFKKSSIVVSDNRSLRRNLIKKNYSVEVTSSNAKAAIKCDIVALTVKPQDMAHALRELSTYVKDKLIVSIAAGISIDFIRKITGAGRIIRVMPNTPALVGCGVTAISYVRGAKASDVNIADRIFKCVGEIMHLDEKHINAITAVSGSGPAYFFLLIESLIKAASSLGINEIVAKELAVHTAFGAVALQYALKTDPSLLRKQVTSKGGTTEAALKVFKRRGFDNLVKEAVKAACKRAEELSL